jgi:hypothetical protein
MIDPGRDPGADSPPGAGTRAPADAGKLRVFISYSRDDLDFADQLVFGLELTGFDPAIDRKALSGGEAWQARLGALIQEADTVVFVLSPSSAASDICEWEVEEAARLNKRILPVVCRPLDGANPPRRLQDLNYIFFYAEPRSPDSGFGSGLARLVKALNTDLDWLREHTRLAQRAAYWEAGGRPANRLLSGGDIAEAKAWLARQPRDAPEPTALHLDFIRASETEEAARLDAQRRQLEAMAAAQAEREAAVAERTAALEAAEDANRRRARLRTFVFVGGAILIAALQVAAVVAGWQAWIASQQTREAVRQGELKEVARREAVAAQEKAEAETRRAETALAQAQDEKDRADAKLKEAQIAQSRFLAEKAREALEAHDYTKAALIALEALPRPGVEPGRPLVDGVSTILLDALYGIREQAVLKEHILAGRRKSIYRFDRVRSAVFNPDGKRVVTASDDGTAGVWDTTSGHEIAVLMGHTGSVRSAAFSPDGKRVVTASGDGTARLWDPADGREIAVLKGHTKDVVSAVFSRDGKWVVTASRDGKVRIWSLPWSSVVDLIDAGIARVPRCLSSLERRDLFLARGAPAWCYAPAKAPYRPSRYGFTPSALDEARAKRLRLPSAEGLLVGRVLKGLPADVAGLRLNDVVLAADGAPLADPKSLTDALDRVPTGASIRLTVLRAGQRLDIVLKPAF